MICDHLLLLGPKKSSMYSREYTSGFSGPVASPLAAPLSPRHEGNVGQLLARFIHASAVFADPL